MPFGFNLRPCVKGEYAMGACGLTSAPCAYITIVREPIARLVSFYKYICLQVRPGIVLLDLAL